MSPTPAMVRCSMHIEDLHRADKPRPPRALENRPGFAAWGSLLARYTGAHHLKGVKLSHGRQSILSWEMLLQFTQSPLSARFNVTSITALLYLALVINLFIALCLPS